MPGLTDPGSRLDDLAASALGQFLTHPTERSDAHRELLVALLRLHLLARGADFVQAVCALIERSTLDFEHATGLTPLERLNQLGKWIEQRQWLADQITAAMARVPATPDATAAMKQLRDRTSSLNVYAVGETARLPVNSRPVKPLTLK